MQEFYFDYNDIRNHGDRRLVGLILAMFIIVTILTKVILMKSWLTFAIPDGLLFFSQLLVFLICIMEWRGISCCRILGKSFLRITEEEIILKNCFVRKELRLDWNNVALIEKRDHKVVVLGYNDRIVRIDTKYWLTEEVNNFSILMCCLAKANKVPVDDLSSN